LTEHRYGLPASRRSFSPWFVKLHIAVVYRLSVDFDRLSVEGMHAHAGVMACGLI
jgi:hypothetical protein